jgi:MFS family permease
MSTRVVRDHPVARARWWHDVTPYQWFMFAVVSSAWLFDNLDQRLFSLARIPALTDLMGQSATGLDVQAFAKLVTASFLIGWGVGGLTIGALGDRFGRARLLTVAVLIYSVGTGLTAISESGWQFAVLRLVTGLGIGGVFGLAVAILAESVSSRARLAMLAILQVLSTVGNIGAALVKMGVDTLASNGVIDSVASWRWLFAAGALPALLAGVSGVYLRESETWLRLKQASTLPKGWFGSYAQLLSQRQDRRNLLLGTLLAIAGVVGLWGIGEYAVDLQHAVFTSYFTAQYPGKDIASQVAQAKNWAYLLQMIGAALGMLAFTYIAGRFGRRPAFIIGFSAAFALTLFVYWRLETPMDAYWMMPLMGVAQFSVFAGFAIYLPELFGARARGTGVSFAYNLGRFAAAAGSFVSALLTTRVFAGFAYPAPLRYAAMTMCSVFLLGLIAALFAPETRGQDLRE